MTLKKTWELRQHTLVVQACTKVSGFGELCQKFEKNIAILGLSRRTYQNKIRHFYQMALHFNCLPTDLCGT